MYLTKSIRQIGGLHLSNKCGDKTPSLNEAKNSSISIPEREEEKGRQLTFEECWEVMGVTKCEDCEVYEACCEYGAEKRAEMEDASK